MPGPHLVPLLRGLVSFHQVRARAEAGRTVGEELLALCAARRRRGGAGAGALRARRHALRSGRARRGRRRHLETALARYDPETHPTHVAIYGGYDPGVACRCWLAWLLWLRGEPDRAVRSVADGLTLAEQLGHPFSIAFACLATAVVHLQRGDVARAAEPLARAIAIAAEDGFPYLGATVASVAAWAELARGSVATAITRGEEAMAAQEATGAAISLPGHLTVLAYAYAFAGNVRRARELVDQGFAVAQQTQQRLHVVGLWRAHGELLLLDGGDAHRAEAEASHRQALDLAHALRAPMLELQAALGYARHLWASDRKSEIRPLLAPAYAVFREGFETGVLREAKTLLDSV